MLPRRCDVYRHKSLVRVCHFWVKGAVFRGMHAPVRLARRVGCRGAAWGCFPKRVRVVEVSPRDGLQFEKDVLPTADKVELIARLRDCGLEQG